MPPSRATVERRQLGTELRKLRESTGRSQREAAEVIERDTSLISRMERGQRALKVMELKALLNFYDASPDIREQISGIAQAARQRQPRRIYSDGLPGAYRRLADHEQGATEIHHAESELVPGLLQTEAYVRALIYVARSASAGAKSEDVEGRVQFRLERQKLIASDTSPQMWFVIGEAALRRPIGGREVHHKQLLHLLDLIERHPHMVVQVAPLSIVDHPLLGGSLEILRFGGVAPDIVQQPTFLGSGVYVTDEQDIAECARAFDRLRAVALGPEESRTFITRVAEELEQGA